MTKLIVDPITRIEGHLKIEVTLENGKVVDAKSCGTMFRGIETLMEGRHPMDAPTISQRVCGVCPTSHSVASNLALEDAFGFLNKVPENGRILRNIVQGWNFLQSHIVHFFHLAALDYVDVTAVAGYTGNDPALQKVAAFIKRATDASDMNMLSIFYPRYEGDYRLSKDINIKATGDYVRALEARRICHEAHAMFTGKMPHGVGIVPGGVTCKPTVENINRAITRLSQVRDFIDNCYIPDVLAVAEAYKDDGFSQGQGCGNFISFGVFDEEASGTNLDIRKRLFNQGIISIGDLSKVGSFDHTKITESANVAWYKDSAAVFPLDGNSLTNITKSEAYSWCKEPRYDGAVYEPGPLARMVINYVNGDKTVQTAVNNVLSLFGAPITALFSTLGRHAARALEAKIVADKMAEWLLQLTPSAQTVHEYVVADDLPQKADGVGLWEAPRGAISHWCKIDNGVISNYQIITPSSWHASGKDASGQCGPIEQSLMGTTVKDINNPFELVRIVRAFDPCLACAVHIIKPNGETLGKFRVA